MIYFLSDAHLGSLVIPNPQDHQAKIISLLQNMSKDATAVYLLGDIFDFWCEFFFAPPKGYDPFLDQLKSMTDSGIQIHFFIGNHDIWTFGWLAQRTGVTVHRQPETLTLNGKRCFLAHGDGLGFTHRSFRIIRSVFHNPVAQFLFRLLPPALGNYIGYNWAKHSRQKELIRPTGYKGEKNEELIQFAKEQEQTAHCDYYIFGHRHIELDLELSTHARILILGDMFRLYTYAQMDEQGNITLMNIEE